MRGQEWWDKSPQAGPKQRAAATEPKPLPSMEILTVQDSRLEFLAFKFGCYVILCHAQ